MPNYPYTQVPGKLKQLLEKINAVGVPPKATNQWLKTLGFTSSNDATVIPVLKFIEFVDQTGVPTPVWTQFRGSHSKTVLGDAIRKGYADLYSIYPDAHARSQTELEHVFKTSSTAGQQVITKTVNTFKALVSEASFSDAPPGELHASGPLHAAPATPPQKDTAVSSVARPSLHIDIQVHISPESSPEQIEKIFASMAKHLYGVPKSGG